MRCGQCLIASGKVPNNKLHSKQISGFFHYLRGSKVVINVIAGSLSLLIFLLGPATFASPINNSDAVILDRAPQDSRGLFQNYSGPIGVPNLRITWPFYFRRSLTLFRGRSGSASLIEDPLKALTMLETKKEDFAYWIGHSTLLVRLGKITFLTDPIWTQYAGPGGLLGAKRYVAPAIPIEKLPKLDFVLISHNHYDHLDISTLRKIAANQGGLSIFIPLKNSQTLSKLENIKLHELNWGERVHYRNAVLTCLPAQHWSRRGLNDMRRALWSSWAVSVADKNFFFAGDTGFFPELKIIGESLGPFDLAALPIGAYEPAAMMSPYHLTPEEAVDAARHLRARQAVAIHFGTFDLSDEPLDEPPRRFRSAGNNAGWSSERLWILQIGEGRSF